ncbi:MAG: PRC-barrel domain-containing protein [Hyphomicrobiaceae bacterium]
MKFFPILALSAALMTSTAFAQQSDSTVPADPPANAEAAPVTPSPSATSPSATDPSTMTTGESAAAPATTADAKGPMMTDDEAKAWVDKVVYSSDGKNLGEVVEILRDNSGHVTELHADIGGFLGLGETRVRIEPKDLKLQNDRVILTIPSDQANALPKIEK